MAESSRSGPPRWVLRATEPVALALAGRRWFPLWAIVHHRGRRSGTAFDTPIAVVPTESAQAFLVGLPWGSRTNWARNVLAAGGATVTWRGERHQLKEPRVIDALEAAASAKPLFRPVVRRFPAAILLTRQ